MNNGNGNNGRNGPHQRGNHGRQPGLFQHGGGGGDQGDHILAHGLIREGIRNEFRNQINQGLAPRDAGQQVAQQLAQMPGHQPGGQNPLQLQLDTAIQALPNRPGLRPRQQAQNLFQHAAEGFEQHNPIGAVRFGGVGHGEGHRLGALRQLEQQLQHQQPGPGFQQQAERNLRGLMDADALHAGIEAQHDGNQHGDDQLAHFPGFVAQHNGQPDFGAMFQQQAQRGAQFAQMAFPRVAQAHGNVQNVFQQHLQQGGDMDIDPDYHP